MAPARRDSRSTATSTSASTPPTPPPRSLRNTIYSNDYGVYSENNGGTLTLTNNLIYNDRTAAIRLIDSARVFEIVNNTIYEPTADAIYATGDDVHLRNNIIWTQAGYGVRIADDKQAGFTSDYNLLYATGTGKIGYWQGDRDTLFDWQFANFRDLNSVSADPRFVDADGTDAFLGAQFNAGPDRPVLRQPHADRFARATRIDRTVNYLLRRAPGRRARVTTTGPPRYSGFVRFDVPGDYTFHMNSGGPQRL